MSFHSYATSRDKEKRIKSQTCCTNGPRPNLCLLFPFTQPRGTGRHFPTHRSIGPRPIFSIFPLRHLVAQSRSPRRTAQSIPDRFFFLTPPRGAFFLSFFLHHLVAQSRSPRHTAQTVPDRPLFVCLFLFLCFFYTASWHRAEVLDALLKRSTTTMRPDKQGQTPLSEPNGP